MKRAIPLLILLGVGGAGAYQIWRSNEPDRRFARIDDLLHAYQDKPHGAWTKGDGDELWRQVTWFNTKDRSGFVARVVERIGSDDPGERYRGALLAAHVEHYANLGRWDWAFNNCWLLPLQDPGEHRLAGFQLRELPRRHPETFARLADDPREPVRHSLIHLAKASDAPVVRDAFIRLASLEAPFESFFAIQSLGDQESDPVATRALALLTESGGVWIRFQAATTLARLGDPAGTRRFIGLLTDLENDLSRDERASGCDVLIGRFVSLGTLGEESSRILEGARPETAFESWRSWLEIREHEGFRADAQDARDAAWKEAAR